MSAQDTFFSLKTERIFDQKPNPVIMGILNVTPDSFFDGGKYTEEAQWLEHAGKMLEEGAGIIDVGACSTRPGAAHISEEAESARLLKVVASLRKHYPGTLISVDTFRAAIAEKAVDCGAGMINDISGGTLDDRMFETVARLDVPYVLMHIQGTPQNMQEQPVYKDVVKEVYEFLETRLNRLNELGLKKVILDPGFGFGKTTEHNLELFRNLEKFGDLNAPLLVGISRKSIVNKVLNIKSKDALNGTTVLNTIALQKGATIIRVHDVKEAKEVVTLVQKIKNADH
ncbi:MAG: Dihydropteroate synthase [Bacteroidetes bacterium]|nr:Dihydropteroate synthase [Bacteroidota bacterium]